jgi:hypothetical protein
LRTDSGHTPLALNAPKPTDANQSPHSCLLRRSTASTNAASDHLRRRP